MTKAFDRILIVMFENQYRNYVINNPSVQRLMKAGMDMTNSFGAFHPSQTNYIASLAGETCAVTNDTPPAAPLMQQTLVDLLEAKGVSWKAYMEAYPGEAWNPAWENPDYPSSSQPIAEYPDNANGQPLANYFRKHNAFASFHTIQKSKDRWAKIVDENEFWRDVTNNTLPEYSWFTPDIWNDGHYIQNTHIDPYPRSRLVPQLATWMEYVFFGDVATDSINCNPDMGFSHVGLNLDLDLLATNPKQAWAQSRVPAGTLIVVTFDEADYNAHSYNTNYDGPNQILTVLLGDMIEPGTSCAQPLNHYGLMRTIERNFDLGDLGKNDATANWVRELWGETFHWGKTTPVGQSGTGDLVMASYEGAAWMVSGDDVLTLSGDHWQTVGTVPCAGTTTDRALAADASGLMLLWVNGDTIQWSRSVDGKSWSAPEELSGALPTGALTACDIIAEGDTSLAAAWAEENGFMASSFWNGSTWSEPMSVGQLTDGPMSLQQFGPSLYLVYKERNSTKMRLTSMNLAAFNAFDAVTFDDKPAPENNTTLLKWSPFDMPVGNFAKKLAALQNDYSAMGPLALAAIDGEMRLVHRGAFENTSQLYTETFSLTGIYTAESQYTNGFGTLDQAGWTKEAVINDVSVAIDSGLALTADANGYVLVWQETSGGPLMWRRAGYAAS